MEERLCCIRISFFVDFIVIAEVICSQIRRFIVTGAEHR